MRKLILFMMFGLTAMTINAQEADNATEAGADSIFKAYLYDDEYQVMLNIDFYDQKLIVPGQEIFGELPGWFGSKRDGRKWLITAVDIQGETAMLEITNERNALERAMLQFSYLAKRTERTGEKTFRMMLHYRKEDETELLIKIISFGPLVRVVEPDSIAALIRERIERQFQYDFA